MHLPAIVEAAESSPNAAKEAAHRIRKYLSNPSKPQGFAQYNAVMLIRILADNPGETFTRNFDAKFVSTIKTFLRDGRDMSSQHLLRETLDVFESQKSWDENLAELLALWKKEKKRVGSLLNGVSFVEKRYSPRLLTDHQRHGRVPRQPPPSTFSQHSSQASRQLPPPEELAARIEEAKSSADLLRQLAETTPATEVRSNELMKEFSERCHLAAQSIQRYMNAENPAPDEDTLVTLIETNDQLSMALSKYQRALLNARKAESQTPGSDTNSNTRETAGTGNSPYLQQQQSPQQPARLKKPPLFPSPSPTASVQSSQVVPANTAPPPSGSLFSTSRYEYNPNDFRVDNPFADHNVSPIERSSTNPNGNSKLA